MKGTQYYIDDILLDGVIDDPIGMSFAVNKFQNLQSRQGDFSTTIKVLRTPNNKTIAGNMESPGVNSPFPFQKHTAKIIQNGIVAVIGFAEVVQTDEYYNITVFSGNSEWISLIGESQLNQLDFRDIEAVGGSTGGVLTYNLADVKFNRLNNYLKAFIFPNINYGKLTNLTGNSIFFTDLYPSIYCYEVLRRIFISIGYYIDLSFMETVNNGLFLTEILPTTITPTVSPDYVESVRSKVINTTNVAYDTNTLVLVGGIKSVFGLSLSSINKNGGNVTTASTPAGNITSPGLWVQGTFTEFYGLQAINYNLNLSITITVSFGATTAKLIIVEWDGNISTTVIGQFTLNTGVTLAVNLPFTPKPGKYYFAYIEPDTSFGGRQVFTVDTGSFIELTLIDNSLQVNNPISLAGCLPNVSQAEFIKLIANQYNVMFIADTHLKKVKIVPFNKVIQNKSKAIDWSDKVDFTNHPVVSYKLDGYGQTTRLLYDTDTGDSLLRDIPLYGQGNLTCNNKNLPVVIDAYTAAFCPVQRQKAFKFGANIDMAFIEKFKADITNNVFTLQNVKPRVAYVNITSTNIVRVGEGDGSGTPINRDNPTQSSEVFFTELIFSNLITSNYGIQISALQNLYMLSIKMRLRAVDVSQIDFTVPIYLSIQLKGFAQIRGYFYLNFINQYLVNRYQSTNVELLLID